MQTRQLLLLRSSQPENAYGRYVGEILRAEGLHGFETVDLDTDPFPEFAAGDLLILTRCFVRPAEIDCLVAAVEQGARLVCLQPSWKFAERLGWTPQCRVVYPGWIAIHQGLPGAEVPIQAHVPIAAYSSMPGMATETLAEAVSSDWQDGGCPAIARQQLGKGEVVLFFYDLPAAVARIRFGNPELASYLTNRHWAWTHACDLFEDHIDPRVHHLPQADMHGQLLAQVLTDISPYPLARFWYYPEASHRAAAVFQSDDDMSTPEQFAELTEMLRAHGASGTFYLMEGTLLPDDTVAAMRAEGHTFAPHVVSAEVTNEGEVIDRQTDWYFTFPEALARETAVFDERYGGHSLTLQSHCAPWYGYQQLVPLHLAQGYRLLFAYLCAPAQRLNRYMCGSGRPLRFCDLDGTVYDCWQQPMPTFDDASIKAQVQADPQPVIAEFARLLRAAVETSHTAIPILSHPVSFSTYSRPYIEACFDMLVAEDVPIFNGDQWYDFIRKRDAARIAQQMAGDKVCCVITGLTATLPLMIPLQTGENLPVVTVNMVQTPVQIVERFGRRYATIQLIGSEVQDTFEVEVRLSLVSHA